eukprot:CAMPEP_0179228464 /NCGR_PEP_ID=MMETSP0797-20121207/9839_1 /TAXON_ID=47934 /ORGANISM="Dinophysis acuminata, Strain DAEP01" /LENGTH=118 /DNA_ID=CAMNT_0020935517 /DNA_START=220 /DNA_END=572 /DNA_ORIENTATION=+
MQLALLRVVVREDREFRVSALMLQAVVVQAWVRPAKASAPLCVEVQDWCLRVLACFTRAQVLLDVDGADVREWLAAARQGPVGVVAEDQVRGPPAVARVRDPLVVPAGVRAADALLAV